LLPEILINYVEYFNALNVFKYITFRTGGSILTALLISFIFGPYLIKKLKMNQIEGQPIRIDGPKSHLIKKKGTPTMGGILILFAFSFSTLLWAKLDNIYVWTVFSIVSSFGIIGLIDDWLKLTKRSSQGLNGKIKLLLQVILATLVVYIINQQFEQDLRFTISLPFFKDMNIYLGYFYILFGVLVIVGSSNAVNLTDGLDGLAIVPVMIASMSFALIAYLIGNLNFSNYLQLTYVSGVGELCVLAGALLGSGLGFLWFNAPPAMVFMGDTGSLSLGGFIGATAVATRHEIVLIIIGGLFVLETVSVIIQVVSYKLTGKRVFKMAPLHHHFEQKGWAESTIVIRFWIIAVILALIGLSTLKLR
jgi:phospho-N-acetylmuramoyl-pentapeptide-transferase|tara:strand:+ start:1001 stop:2089 length:1089 start_codon:yes stop_codon:yes gene_type:complete